VGSDGTVWCWGENYRGKNGTTGPRLNVPTKIAKDALNADFTNVKSVSVGRFVACALKNDGTVWCWGNNTFGELGQGTHDFNDNARPRQVPGLPPGIVGVDARGGYSSVIVVTAAGDVMAWGTIQNFTFGDGVAPIGVCESGTACQKSPRRIGVFPPMANVQQQIGLARNGQVWGWGDNTRAWLGHPPGTAGDSFCSGATGTPCSPVARKIPVYP
jgi:alpha-tubulin suppressor-like RCC1 family protein